MPPAKKRKASEDGGKGGLTDFELQRERLIARNRARLAELGIQIAVASLTETIEEERAVKKVKTESKAKKKPKAKSEPSGPSRRSSRIASKSSKDVTEAPEDPEATFAKFLIDGECPKCGKIFNRGHRKHFDSCDGKRVAVRPQLTPEEQEQADKKRSKTEKARLRELELSGLIEFTDEQAKFVVIGSTGNHYTVTLSDSRFACQCMDFRIRRRRCKHIRLVLSQLGIEDTPKKWKEAVNSMAGECAEEDG